VTPGDVVICAFPGAQVTKTRPAVVLSTEEYNRQRPDVIVGLITTQAPNPRTSFDVPVRGWKQAGLHSESYFRLFLVTRPKWEVRQIGRLTESDWAEVRACMKSGLPSE